MHTLEVVDSSAWRSACSANVSLEFGKDKWYRPAINRVQERHAVWPILCCNSPELRTQPPQILLGRSQALAKSWHWQAIDSFQEIQGSICKSGVDKWQAGLATASHREMDFPACVLYDIKTALDGRRSGSVNTLSTRGAGASPSCELVFKRLGDLIDTHMARLIGFRRQRGGWCWVSEHDKTCEDEGEKSSCRQGARGRSKFQSTCIPHALQSVLLLLVPRLSIITSPSMLPPSGAGRPRR